MKKDVKENKVQNPVQKNVIKFYKPFAIVPKTVYNRRKQKQKVRQDDYC